MRGTFWRQDDIETLVRLWRAGETADAIGRRLGGLSRSAVLGKVFRLRLGAAARPESGDVNAVPAPARRRAGKPAVAAPAASPRQGKTLLELTNACCRFPYVPPPQMAV